MLNTMRFLTSFLTIYWLLLIQDNWTALLNAAKDGHVEVSNVLLGNGANIDHRDIVRR